jgi:hypothetical protein
VAILRLLDRRRCDRCKRLATHKLLAKNLREEGYYCRQHGQQAWDEARVEEEQAGEASA